MNDFKKSLKREVKAPMRTLLEMIKAEKEQAIEQQEQQQSEDFNRGREEACEYVIECINQLIKQEQENEVELINLRSDFNGLTDEEIEAQNIFDIKELVMWYGDFNSLRNVIARMEKEELENEEYDRMNSYE
jgi:hypothetical protein